MAEHDSTKYYSRFFFATLQPASHTQRPHETSHSRTSSRPAHAADSLDYWATIGQKSAECAAKAKNARNRSAGANSNKSSRLLGEKNLGDFLGGRGRKCVVLGGVTGCDGIWIPY